MDMQNSQNKFHFNISLSVLNHLGRNLYRSFVTVLGEAISNSWDADAENVWIDVDKDNNFFCIKDDGIGMSRDDFQNKFLKISYSKRKDGFQSKKKRPFIGQKGIGKLALLSCAQKISIASKQKDGDYVGGVIDNTELDKAIADDLNPQEYSLREVDNNVFETYQKNHDNGTIIYFEDFNDGIRNTLEYLRKLIALYFRFSLLDKNFAIYFNGEKITENDLTDIASKTEFLWILSKHKDPFTDTFSQLKDRKEMNDTPIKGFIASVEKPTNLKIRGTEERASIDLFVNGRLREKDILKQHIPTARIPESYLYGQIHYDELDSDRIDRFTSNREGIVADDPKYKEFIENFSKIINRIMNDWDKLRRKHKEDGDSENGKISKKERKSEELFNNVIKESFSKEYRRNNPNVDKYINKIKDNAKYNAHSYVECFLSENLLREFIKEKKCDLSKKKKNDIEQYRKHEEESKQKGNLSIRIREDDDDVSYLSMEDLTSVVDQKNDGTKSSLNRDAKEYKPIRNAMAHTALLTTEAQKKFTTIYNNIIGRLKDLLSINSDKN